MRRIVVLMALAAGLSTPVPAAAEPDVTAEIDVSFAVRNVNRSSVPCPADGRNYTVRGTLIGPSEALGDVTTHRINILVHDITTGGWFWHMPGHPEFDYASRLADNGEVSLVLDRLGYDTSPIARGTSACLGSQADVLHQVVQQVRAGTSDVPRPDHVIVHGHSVGAAIAQAEASKWKDVDGLVLMSWSDAGVSPRAIKESALQHSACLLGGGRSGAPRGYAWYGRTQVDFRAIHFTSSPADIQAAASNLRNPDPCGDAISLAQLVALGNVITRTIDVPVLLLFGGEDVLNRPGAPNLQRIAYSPRAEVTVHTDADAGGALPLERNAAALRAQVKTWLCATSGCT